MDKKKWLDWLRCNLLEIIILILVLVLLVKVFSAPAAEVTGKEMAAEVQEKFPLKSLLIGKAAEEAGETSVEGEEQPLPETAEELPSSEPTTSE